MQLIDSRSVVNILRNTLNYVDGRLSDHGRRVSYMAYRVLSAMEQFSPEELRDMCLLAMLHDIGAYKTEEIDQMTRFETEDVWDHSIWGYLFLIYFSPLEDIAPAVLYHHTDFQMLPGLDPLHTLLAQVIHIADRVDIYMMQGIRSWDAVLGMLRSLRGGCFRADIVDIFCAALPCRPDEMQMDTDAGYHAIMHEVPFAPEVIKQLLRMNIMSIDFRSCNTATHTMTTGAISREIAELMGMPRETIQKITTGAMLHDLGKTGIPVEILEHPGKLSAQAMRIMRRHVEMTESILSGNVPEETLRIAVRHHEKLDGSGYPRGLCADDLTFPERLVAVSDIFSALYEARSYKQNYPKERITGILQRMAQDGLVDAEIVAFAVEHYDIISARVELVRGPVLESFARLQTSYEDLKQRFDPGDMKRMRPPRFQYDDQYRHL